MCDIYEAVLITGQRHWPIVGLMRTRHRRAGVDPTLRLVKRHDG